MYDHHHVAAAHRGPSLAGQGIRPEPYGFDEQLLLPEAAAVAAACIFLPGSAYILISLTSARGLQKRRRCCMWAAAYSWRSWGSGACMCRTTVNEKAGCCCHLRLHCRLWLGLWLEQWGHGLRGQASSLMAAPSPNIHCGSREVMGGLWVFAPRPGAPCPRGREPLI